mmetsp:Transcript_11089/g.39180  ORF Transcript_11089/g.39180 Transcript_11089/m.39180 type:complete len:218 (-) Transcript_11089:329-982(-)
MLRRSRGFPAGRASRWPSRRWPGRRRGARSAGAAAIRRSGGTPSAAGPQSSTRTFSSNSDALGGRTSTMSTAKRGAPPTRRYCDASRAGRDASSMHRRAQVALHRRAWERRVVDADLGWFLLVSTLTRRALGSSPDGSVVLLAAFDERDPRLHWCFDRLADDGAATHKRALHHRASHSRARVHDHGMKRAVLSLGSDYDVGAFVPLPVRHEVFEASV